MADAAKTLEKTVVAGRRQGVARGVASGVARGVASGVAEGVAEGVARGVARGVAELVWREVWRVVWRKVWREVWRSWWASYRDCTMHARYLLFGWLLLAWKPCLLSILQRTLLNGSEIFEHVASFH